MFDDLYNLENNILVSNIYSRNIAQTDGLTGIFATLMLYLLCLLTCNDINSLELEIKHANILIENTTLVSSLKTINNTSEEFSRLLLASSGFFLSLSNSVTFAR